MAQSNNHLFASDSAIWSRTTFRMLDNSLLYAAWLCSRTLVVWVTYLPLGLFRDFTLATCLPWMFLVPGDTLARMSHMLVLSHGPVTEPSFVLDSTQTWKLPMASSQLAGEVIYSLPSPNRLTSAMPLFRGSMSTVQGLVLSPRGNVPVHLTT